MHDTSGTAGKASWHTSTFLAAHAKPRHAESNSAMEFGSGTA